MAESRESQVFVQASILAAASMLVRVIGLLYRAPLTAIIGDEGNGYYGTAYNIYTIILMVSSYSVPSAISKLMAQKLAVGAYRDARRIFHCALAYGLAVGILGSALLYFGAGALVPDVAVGVLRVFAPTVFLFGILGALRGYFQAKGSMVQTSVSQILEQIANAAVSIGAAWGLMRLVADRSDTTRAQYGAMGSALGTGSGVVAALLFMAFCYFRAKREDDRLLEADVRRREIPYGEAMRQTIAVITPFMLSGFILNLTTSLNQTIYYRIEITGRGMDPVRASTLYGIFSNKAVVISNIPISIATAVAAAIIPGISAAFARGESGEAAERSLRAKKLTAIIAIPSFVGLCVLAKPITWVMFPQMGSLDQASRLLAMLAVTVFFYSVSTITNACLQSIGRMQQPLISAGIALIVQSAALVILLLFTGLGIYSLVLVSILYSALIFGINEHFLRRYLPGKGGGAALYLGPAGCALGMGVICRLVYEAVTRITAAFVTGGYAVNLTGLAAAMAAAVISYFILLLKTGTFRGEELEALPKGRAIAGLARRLHLI